MRLTQNHSIFDQVFFLRNNNEQLEKIDSTHILQFQFTWHVGNRTFTNARGGGGGGNPEEYWEIVSRIHKEIII